MKKPTLLLILFFLSVSTSFAQKNSLKNKKELQLNLPVQEDRYSKYTQEKYAPPPKLEKNKKLKEKDIDFDMDVDVNKTTKEVDKLKLDVSKKF